MGKYFGTDGIRGVANKELTPMLAFNIAKASTHVLKQDLNKDITVIIGKDTRISCDMLEAAMVAGFTSVGVNVKLLGVIPTPAIAYLTRQYKADIGVVISASHNSFEFNGIKIFSSQGTKLPEEIEKKIEEQIDSECNMIEPVLNDKIGKCETIINAKQDYIDFAVSTIDIKNTKLKVGLDCANGSTSLCAKEIFEKLGLDVTVIHNIPNGININDKCGSTHIESLKSLVKENGLDIGFAFDGDGDRIMAVNSKGQLVDGDQIMAICAKHLKDNNKLANNTLVVTMMSNLGLSIFAKENNINVIQTKVGDKYVLEEMLKSNHSFGGEQSGHIIFKEYNTTGDGIITALQLTSIILNTGKTIEELSEIVKIYPQVTVNARVLNDKKYEYIEDMEIVQKIKELEEEFKAEGRVVIRPSGTEPLIRVMIEGTDIEYIQKRANEIASLIEKKYNI